jgi:hypothetical protein
LADSRHDLEPWAWKAKTAALYTRRRPMRQPQRLAVFYNYLNYNSFLVWARSDLRLRRNSSNLEPAGIVLRDSPRFWLVTRAIGAGHRKRGAHDSIPHLLAHGRRHGGLRPYAPLGAGQLPRRIRLAGFLQWLFGTGRLSRLLSGVRGWNARAARGSDGCG